MQQPSIVFGNRPETILRATPAPQAPEANRVLLGTYLRVCSEQNGFYRVATRRAGRGGWVDKDHVTESLPLRIFFVDVGQGDGTLVECPQGVVVVDGGRSRGFHRFMRHRYAPLLQNRGRVHIEAMIISHPDWDHYRGLQYVLEDNSFTVGTIYHNGLMRYPREKEDSLSHLMKSGGVLKRNLNGRSAYFLTDTIDDLADIESRKGDMSPGFSGFWSAALAAEKAGRLGAAKRLFAGNTISGFSPRSSNRLELKVLAPVLTQLDTGYGFLAFGEPTPRDEPRPAYPSYGFSHSHTRNGHSIVIRLEFGKHRLLLGGDLNIPAEQHLLDHYGGRTGEFTADVAKACHHGSSDFSPEFVELVRSHATIVSSGDDATYGHPTADAIGSMARCGCGCLPLVFSTELAREVPATGGKGRIHYGLINVRSNGTTLTMAQMKENRRRGVDVWDSYTVPWHGRFWYERED